MKPVLPAVSLLLTLAAPALAQPAKEPVFYVVLNSLTRKCTVVDQTPRTDTPNITVASDTSIYPTRAAAEDAIKALSHAISKPFRKGRPSWMTVKRIRRAARRSPPWSQLWGFCLPS